MVITKVRNKTALPITIGSLVIEAQGDAQGRDVKVIFYNRPFWTQETEIRRQMFLGAIVLLDDENNVVCRKNPNYVDHNSHAFDGEELMGEYFIRFGLGWTGNDEDIIDIEEEAGRAILRIMRGLLKRLMAAGSLPNYTKTLFNTALNGTATTLKNGDFTDASSKLGAVGTDAFFTTLRKNRFKNLCDAVNLT